MCYKSPGPRCSAWAKKRLIQTKQALSTWDDDYGTHQARVVAFDQAKLDFDATPAGHKYLKMRIAQGADYNGKYAERLKNGITLRKMQLAAIKSSDEGDNFNHDFESPFHTTTPHPKDMTTPREGWEWGDEAPEIVEYDRASENALKVLNAEEHAAVYWVTSDGGPYLNTALSAKGAPKKVNEKWTWEDRKRELKFQGQGDNARKYSPTFLKTKVSALNSAFKKHRLNESAHLYRGLNKWALPDQVIDYGRSEEETNQAAFEYLRERYPVGKEIRIHEYMSTTADPAIAKRFTSGRGSIVLEIQTKAAIPVGNMSSWKNAEREYLVNKGGKYMVEGIYQDVPYLGPPEKGKKKRHSKNVTVVRLIEIESEKETLEAKPVEAPEKG